MRDLHFDRLSVPAGCRSAREQHRQTAEGVKLLIQFPTRERPEKFRIAYNAARKLLTNPEPGVLSGPNNVVWIFPVDSDDAGVPWYWLNQYGEGVPGTRVSKIEACNRGLPGDQPWDIVVLMSDDMICQVKGWDEIIREDMAREFPDTDGCLWYPDGHQQRLCTLAVMGRRYFENNGRYIYHPSYKSLWADNEQHEVAESQGKLYHSDKVLFKHLHPGWGAAKVDPLYKLNESFDAVDKANFHARKAQGFPHA